MWQAVREILERIRQREPIVIIACVVLLALIASGWMVEGLLSLFGR
jgi:hypothetical protein